MPIIGDDVPGLIILATIVVLASICIIRTLLR